MNLWKSQGRTDTASAKRLVILHGDDIRWCDPWHKWLVWDGRRWAIDNERAIDRLAKDVGRMLWKKVARAGESAGEKLLREMVGFAKSSGNATAVRNMVSLARSLAVLPA